MYAVCRSSWAFPPPFDGFHVVRPVSPARGDVHPASRATSLSGRAFSPCLLLALALAVGHPKKALPDVGCADTRSAQISRPAGVTLSFQLRRYNIPPREGIFARNLLSKDRCRAMLADEIAPGGPEMPLIGETGAAAGEAERLAWARARPNRTIIRPPGASESVRPHADPREEMTLRKTLEISGVDFTDIALIDDTGGDMASIYEVLQPLRGERIIFVIVGRHSVCGASLGRKHAQPYCPGVRGTTKANTGCSPPLLGMPMSAGAVRWRPIITGVGGPIRHSPSWVPGILAQSMQFLQVVSIFGVPWVVEAFGAFECPFIA